MECDPIGLSGGINTYAYVASSPIAHADPFGLCRIELRFKQVPIVGRFGIYHAYVVTIDPNGSQSYFRGGPSDRMTLESVFGNIATNYGPYLPNTKDYSNRPRPSLTLLNDSESCACETQTFSEILNKLNNANIPYGPGERNSNSVVGTMLRESGFPVNQDQLPVYAPQFDNQLPDTW